MYTEKQPCGTYAAYRRHLYYGEPPCRPCRLASAAARRNQYKPKPTARRPRPAAPEPSGWQPGFVVDVLALLDVCEALDGPGPEWYREARDGAA